MKNSKILQEVLRCEADALIQLSSRITDESSLKMEVIFENLRSLGGSLIISGVGKSGIIAQKIASTFSSLGLPSFFLHPIEALHGDLGRVTKRDAIILISKSGTTEEVLKMMPFLKIPKERTIGLLGNINGSIAKECGLIWDCSVEKEACLNNQAPTTSSTVALAMGDALAVMYENFVGLSKEGFAENHPGGFLGKSLSLKVSDLMIKAGECPLLNKEQTLKECLLEMTKFPIGMAAVIEEEKLIGIMVEGDIRRALAKNENALELTLKELMNIRPIVASSEIKAFEALKLMETGKSPLSVLPIVNEGFFIGAVRLHDLLKEGFALSKK